MSDVYTVPLSDFHQACAERDEARAVIERLRAALSVAEKSEISALSRAAQSSRQRAEVERLRELLVERDGDYLSYGQLRERLVEAESLVSRHNKEIERLRDELKAVKKAARTMYVESWEYVPCD